MAQNTHNNQSQQQQSSLQSHHHHHHQQQQQQPPQQQQQQQQQQQPQQQFVNSSTQIQSNQPAQQTQNNNFPPNHLSQTHAFSQLPLSGVYMHSPCAQPVSGALYHMLSTASLPSSVYVHNVTANVNLHGYPVQPYVSESNSTFASSEAQQNATHIPEQNTSIQNTMMQNVANFPALRNQRRSRGRSINGNNRRSDFNQRQQHTSPVPPEISAPPAEAQALGGYIQYGYPYSYFGPPTQSIAHPQAQQATGNPLYVTAGPLPIFPTGPQMYSYPGVVYHSAMIPQDYPVADGKSEEQSEVIAPQMWPMPIYHEEYMTHEVVEDVNHNLSPMTSSDTPSMLSPSYPMYEGDMQSLELQQQMSVMHIFDAQTIPQELPILEQAPECQSMNTLPCEEVLNSSLLQIGNNLAHPNDTEYMTHNEIPLNKTSLTNMTLTFMSRVSQASEQISQTLPNVVENENIQQSANVNMMTRGLAKNEFMLKKDYNQNVPILEQQRPEKVANDKQLPNDISGTSSLSEHTPARGFKKTMSWTNHKKNTASVAVTATPSANKSFTPVNKSNNNAFPNSSSTIQTVQVKNYGVMKTPSSPAATNENDKKEMQRPQNEVEKTSANCSSVASTIVPQKLQESKSSGQGKHVSESLKHDSEPTAEEDMPTVASPPSVPAAPLSWASLFATKSTKPASNTTEIQNNSRTVTPTQLKKPVAKVLPFESTSNFVPSVTPGNMSYSAASAQGLPNSQFNRNTNANVKTKSSLTTVESTNFHREATDEWSLKFADFLTKHKIDYSFVSLKPRGLTNRSNYCYINAILQALIGCPPFYNLMKSVSKQIVNFISEKSNTTPTIHAMIQLVAEFSQLPPGARLNRRERGQKRDDLSAELMCDPSFEPTAIYKLWNSDRSNVEGRQEDAEEFLSYVLNKLNDEMLEIIKLIAKPTVEQNGAPNEEGDDGGEDWQMIYNNRNKGSITRQTDFGRTPVSDIFRGELRSRLQREGEHSVTDVIQPFFTLQLNIEKAASVKEALEILVGRDQLEGVTCSKTNQEVVAWQQMTLEKLPVVLILHLKWFDYKMDGCTKIFKTVEFPIELKIDAKILASKKYSQKQKLYRLFAIVYHDGKEASKGHYITDVYHTGYSSWLRYDDSSVKPVSENNVLRPRAPRVPYLLYYRRCDTVPAQNAANK